jgi:hypothetical protein
VIALRVEDRRRRKGHRSADGASRKQGDGILVVDAAVEDQCSSRQGRRRIESVQIFHASGASSFSATSPVFGRRIGNKAIVQVISARKIGKVSKVALGRSSRAIIQATKAAAATATTGSIA